MKRDERISWLKQIESDIYVDSLGITYEEYMKSRAIHEAIEALQKDQNWIPVIVKLPEEEEKPYWVCLDDGYQCECRWTNNMYGVGTNEWSEWGWNIMDKPQYSRVVAWMPLPEPYEPQESEDAE